MMLPSKNPVLPSAPEDKEVVATLAPASTYELALLHVDYNLHPLTVHSLEHYLNAENSEELFHIR